MVCVDCTMMAPTQQDTVGRPPSANGCRTGLAPALMHRAETPIMSALTPDAVVGTESSLVMDAQSLVYDSLHLWIKSLHTSETWG